MKEEWEKDKRKKQRQTQKLKKKEQKGRRKKKYAIQSDLSFIIIPKRTEMKIKTQLRVFSSILPLHEAAVGKSEGVPCSAHLHVLNQSEVADLHTPANNYPSTGVPTKTCNIVDTLRGLGWISEGTAKEGLVKLDRERYRKGVYNTIPYSNDRETYKDSWLVFSSTGIPTKNAISLAPLLTVGG